MAYSKHNFDGNQMIYASDLQDMDEAIYKCNTFQNSNVQISKEGHKIQVYCGGLQNGNYVLKLKRRSRSNGRTGRWIGIKHFGYAQLCDQQSTNTQLPVAVRSLWAGAVIPPEMGDGYLPSSFQVQAQGSGEISFELDPAIFFIPLAKPVEAEPFIDKLEPDTDVALYGLNKRFPYRELHFTFWLYDENDNLIAKSNEYFGFGPFARKKPSKQCYVTTTWDDEAEQLKLDNFRISVY